MIILLQQYLPFTVLKHLSACKNPCSNLLLQQYLPFTVLKLRYHLHKVSPMLLVTTVLTVYGIETLVILKVLVAVLVTTVLTVYGIETYPCSRYDRSMESIPLLQQYLPFTVLKLSIDIIGFLRCWCVTTVLTVYGIETLIERNKIFKESYNSTYRLRY